MKEPHRFTSLLNTSYIITFVVYSTMATAGYLMFGEFTLDEITKNLAAVPFYNAALNTLTIWLIAINPMTKYALTLRPISTNFELWFLAHTNQSSNPATTLALSESYPLRLQLSAGWLVHVPFRMIQIMFRTLLSSLVLVVSILFPGFERIISLLGSLFSFIVSVIFPIACYLKLFRPGMGVLERMILYTLLAASCAMALTGTIWALLPHDIIGIESRNIFQ
jgi:vesicular inhibitory amino acid transporter